jgi:hypothetical protein
VTAESDDKLIAEAREHGEQPILMRDFADLDGFDDETFEPWVIS